MKPEKPNHLSQETSLYLKQHAFNPVDWYPWGEEALALAKKLNKPIVVSIGYSACHWCHVMEKESFENIDIAQIQNEHFISIKVDREERPDIDEIYMNAVQMITGRGGWPLHVFLTPDLKPFYGGTYFPPTDRMNMIGWGNLLKQIALYYQNHQEDLQKNKQHLFDQLKNLSVQSVDQKELDDTPLQECFESLTRTFDKAYGGFGGAPKFPHATDLQLLLQSAQKSTNENLKNMALLTLEKMARGGMYDQIGGGFHRYSTDEKWLIPHYEKMLYDNALLLKPYTEAFLLTGNTYFRDIILEVAKYLEREMQAPEGYFYSAQDADSEGEEGKFYVWTRQEFFEALPQNDAQIFCDFYGITERGNFEHGKNSPWIEKDFSDFLQQTKQSREIILQSLARSKEALFILREKRIKPNRDEKMIVAWNALAISGLAKAALHLQNKPLLEMALRAKDFILTKMISKNLLFRIFAKDENGAEHIKIQGFLEDYAFLTEALIDLFEASGDPKILQQAVELHELTDRYFFKQGYYYFTQENQSDVIVRTNTGYDGSTPSGQSVALSNIFRLSKILGSSALQERFQEVVQNYFPKIIKAPRAFTKMLQVLDFYLHDFDEVVLVGDSQDTLLQDMKNYLVTSYLPRKVFVFIDVQKSKDWQAFPVFSEKLRSQIPAIYFCKNQTCEKPIFNLGELKRRLEKE